MTLVCIYGLITDAITSYYMNRRLLNSAFFCRFVCLALLLSLGRSSSLLLLANCRWERIRRVLHQAQVTWKEDNVFTAVFFRTNWTRTDETVVCLWEDVDPKCTLNCSKTQTNLESCLGVFFIGIKLCCVYQSGRFLDLASGQLFVFCWCHDKLFVGSQDVNRTFFLL